MVNNHRCRKDYSALKLLTNSVEHHLQLFGVQYMLIFKLKKKKKKKKKDFYYNDDKAFFYVSGTPL
jgi:hypothetical protein